MLFCFDFHEFAEKIAKNHMVVDVWGMSRNIADADVIITESMLKLWSSYPSFEEYDRNCDLNGFEYSITKVTPKTLDNVRNLNYQYLQSYKLSESDIDALIQPTLDNIQGVLGGDINKTILYLKGYFIGEKTIDNLDADFVKALMIDPRMINDPFVQSKLKTMLNRRINDAKMGVLQVDGNFSLMSGDPYMLCQSMFNLAPTGLLKANEFYSHYWNARKVSQIVGFRSPMSCHNNIRLLNLVENDVVNYWYRHMPEVTILNAWDLTCASFNGSDFDGDIVFTTNNPVLLKNTQTTLPIVCSQKKGEKVLITQENLIESDMRGFGDEIGSTTNKITAMFDIQAKFNEQSTEYRTLEYRIMCGQKFQQDAIDKIKGIECKPMPKRWYDKHKISSEDTLNQRIVVDKKPYFFIYNYPELKQEYERYHKLISQKCAMLFGKSLESLLNSDDLTEEERSFVDWYITLNPITDNTSTMNIICHKIEEKLQTMLVERKTKSQTFDYSILKSEGNPYRIEDFKAVQMVYEEYRERCQEFKKNAHKCDKYALSNARELFKENFKAKTFEMCPNRYILGNILLDMCYTNNNSKQFAWDVCGNVFVENLLKKNDFKIKYLEMVDGKGDISYNGRNFVERFKTVNVNEV
jgi:hypothetical protein